MKNRGLIFWLILALVCTGGLPAFSQVKLISEGAKVAVRPPVRSAEVRAASEGGLTTRVLKTTGKFKGLPFYERFKTFYPGAKAASVLSLEEIKEIASGEVPLKSLTEVEKNAFIHNAPEAVISGEVALADEPRQLLADYYLEQLYNRKKDSEKLAATLNLAVFGDSQVAREIYGVAITSEPMYDALFIRSLNAMGAEDYIQKLLRYRLKQENPLSPAWEKFKLYGEEKGVHLDIPSEAKFSNETNIMLNQLDLKMFSPQPYNVIFLLGDDVELATDLVKVRESVLNLRADVAKVQVEQAVKKRLLGISPNSLEKISLLDLSKPAGEMKTTPSVEEEEIAAGFSKEEMVANNLLADLEEFVEQNGGLPSRTSVYSTERRLYRRMVFYLYKFHGNDPQILSLVEKYKGVSNNALQEQWDLLNEYIAFVNENDRLPSTKAPEGSRERVLVEFGKTSASSMNRAVRREFKKFREQYSQGLKLKTEKREAEMEYGREQERQAKYEEYKTFVKENGRLPSPRAPQGSDERKMAFWANNMLHKYPDGEIAEQLRNLREKYRQKPGPKAKAPVETEKAVVSPKTATEPAVKQPEEVVAPGPVAKTTVEKPAVPHQETRPSSVQTEGVFKLPQLDDATYAKYHDSFSKWLETNEKYIITNYRTQKAFSLIKSAVSSRQDKNLQNIRDIVYWLQRKREKYRLYLGPEDGAFKRIIYRGRTPEKAQDLNLNDFHTYSEIAEFPRTLESRLPDNTVLTTDRRGNPLLKLPENPAQAKKVIEELFESWISRGGIVRMGADELGVSNKGSMLIDTGFSTGHLHVHFELIGKQTPNMNPHDIGYTVNLRVDVSDKKSMTEVATMYEDLFSPYFGENTQKQVDAFLKNSGEKPSGTSATRRR